jgi:hypothetical protein
VGSAIGSALRDSKDLVVGDFGAPGSLSISSKKNAQNDGNADGVATPCAGAVMVGHGSRNLVRRQWQEDFHYSAIQTI